MSMIGKTLAHYEITAQIGKGGMGEVYQAKDQKLGRDVAIKILPQEFARDADRVARFQREAKLLASLNHPNIAAIYGLEVSDGTNFLVLELVNGETLADRIKTGPIPVEESLKLALQIAEALEAAHEKGVIHRDLKPANIKVTPAGKVKVLDFGLAKAFAAEQSELNLSNSPTLSNAATQQGVILGTPAYMSPEQAEGKAVDGRSDVFSFGAVFYEMLSGRRAFQGDSYLSTLSAILRETPTSVRKLRADVPVGVEQFLKHCLEKNPGARYASAAGAWKELTALQSQFAVRRVGFGQILRRPWFAIPALIVLVALTAISGWFWVRNSWTHWARTLALPEISRLVKNQRGCAALRLMEKAAPYLQGDPEFESLRQNSTLKMSIRTDPPGADFFIRDYDDVANNPEWVHLGRTPLETVVIPTGYLAYRIVKEGFDDVEGTGYGSSATIFEKTLNAKENSPPGMIWIPPQKARDVALIMTEPIRDLGLEGYWLDKYEVTNRQFKEFVDQGGYEKREYWKGPIIKDGRIIPWEEAITLFRDTTGRTGPATWEFGTYTQDRADYPVGGVSWYEAAAYAEFAGKSLPTVHHWSIAAGNTQNASILQVSNFAGKGPAKVGSYRGLSPYGSYDMAGNVREWCLNPSGGDRYILGGSWSEPSYKFLTADVCSSLDRSSINGFRCAKYNRILPQQLTGPVRLLAADRRGDKPAGDASYQAYRSFHKYTRGDLKPAIESSEDKQYWHQEKVSFQAAYGDERVMAYLYLPKNAIPPFQTIVFFPGSNALNTKSSSNLDLKYFDFIIRSGRALIFPIYKGTYERGGSDSGLRTFVNDVNVWRDISIDSFKDLGRSLDYLQTRAEIDREKFAYCGLSWGAAEGPRMIALDTRLKAGVLLFGGCWQRGIPAEVDPLNFAPRARAPILMVNGKFDTIFPLEGTQIPLFQFLGTPEKNKRHFLMDVGHGVINDVIIRETLWWLDHYLGPVHTR